MSKFLKLFVVFAVLISSSLAYAKDIWYCPMHPNYTSDRAGLCPICNMSLVLKKGNPSAEAAAMAKEQNKGMDGYASVALNTQQIQIMGVKTSLVKREVLTKRIRAAGYVSTVHDLYKYQDELIKASVEYVTTYRDYKRFAHSRRNWETHRELQLKLHEAKDNLLRLGLGQMEVEKLEKVNWRNAWQQPELLFLKDNSMYWVVAQIFESDRGFLAAGQEVDIDIPSYNEPAKGVIRTIGGILDSDTRTVNALIELKDYRGELEGNMFVNVNISVELGESLMVPKTAVMDTGLKKIVYVQSKPGEFEPRDIKVTALGDNGWAVKSGLKEGEQVAVEGNFLLDSESRLQASFQGAMEGHDHGN